MIDAFAFKGFYDKNILISDWLQKLDIDFPVLESGVDVPAQSDVQMRGDLFC